MFLFLKKLLSPGLDVGARKRMKFVKYFKAGDILTLDAGCGNGAFGFAAYKKGNRVIGVDFDEEKLKRTEKFRDYLGFDPKKCDFRIHNIYDLPSLNRKFDPVRNLARARAPEGPMERAISNGVDQIICFETLEHLKDDEKVIQIFSEILNENGILHLCVPCLNRKPYYGEIISEIEDGNHMRLGYTFEQLENMLQNRGFQILKRDTAVGFISQKLINFNNWFDLNLFKNFSGRTKDIVHFISFIFLYPLTFFDGIFFSKPLNIYVKAQKNVCP